MALEKDILSDPSSWERATELHQTLSDERNELEYKLEKSLESEKSKIEKKIVRIDDYMTQVENFLWLHSGRQADKELTFTDALNYELNFNKSEFVKTRVEEFNKFEEERDCEIQKGDNPGMWTRRGARLQYYEENRIGYCLCKLDEFGDTEIGFAIFNDEDSARNLIHPLLGYAYFTPYKKVNDKVKLYNQKNCTHAFTMPISFEEIDYKIEKDETKRNPTLDDVIMIEKERRTVDVLGHLSFEKVFDQNVGNWIKYFQFGNSVVENITNRLVDLVMSAVSKDTPCLLNRRLDKILENITACEEYKSESEKLNFANKVRLNGHYFNLFWLMKDNCNDKALINALSGYTQKIYNAMLEDINYSDSKILILAELTGIFPDVSKLRSEQLQELYKVFITCGQIDEVKKLNELSKIPIKYDKNMFECIDMGYISIIDNPTTASNMEETKRKVRELFKLTKVLPFNFGTIFASNSPLISRKANNVDYECINLDYEDIALIKECYYTLYKNGHHTLSLERAIEIYELTGIRTDNNTINAWLDEEADKKGT